MKRQLWSYSSARERQRRSLPPTGPRTRDSTVSRRSRSLCFRAIHAGLRVEFVFRLRRFAHCCFRVADSFLKLQLAEGRQLHSSNWRKGARMPVVFRSSLTCPRGSDRARTFSTTSRSDQRSEPEPLGAPS